ncbi:hypothetical protein RI367_002815 [Sorochytrium milnesiophthora]
MRSRVHQGGHSNPPVTQYNAAGHRPEAPRATQMGGVTSTIVPQYLPPGVYATRAPNVYGGGEPGKYVKRPSMADQGAYPQYSNVIQAQSTGYRPVMQAAVNYPMPAAQVMEAPAPASLYMPYVVQGAPSTGAYDANGHRKRPLNRGNNDSTHDLAAVDAQEYQVYPTTASYSHPQQPQQPMQQQPMQQQHPYMSQPR